MRTRKRMRSSQKGEKKGGGGGGEEGRREVRRGEKEERPLDFDLSRCRSLLQIKEEVIVLPLFQKPSMRVRADF